MGDMRNPYKILVEKPEKKGTLERTRRRWKNNIKMKLKEIEDENADRIQLNQDENHCRAFVHTILNLRFK